MRDIWGVMLVCAVVMSSAVWAGVPTCYSARDCMCIAEAKPVCNHTSGTSLGVCGCIPQHIPATAH